MEYLHLETAQGLLCVQTEQLPPTADFERDMREPRDTEHGRMALLCADAYGSPRNIYTLLSHYDGMRRSTLLTARLDGVLAGVALYSSFLGAELERPVSLLETLASADQYRGKHLVGPALLAGTIALAEERGARHLEVRCEKPRIPFYSRHGFSVVGMRDDEIYKLRRDIPR